MNTEPTVYIIDDDFGARRSMRWLLESANLKVEAFQSGPDFLEQIDPDMAGCALLDVRMPQMSGLELQERLLAADFQLPLIFLTGHGDLPVCVRAFRAGAFDFLQKPVNDQLLIETVQIAIARDLDRRQRVGALGDHRAEAMPSGVRELLSSLTDREREVATYLLDGQSLKQISTLLGISFQTAAKHRTRILEKTKVNNEVELLRVVGGLGEAKKLLA